MGKRLKITFEEGEVIYAKLLENEAPEMVQRILSMLPMTVDMVHGQVAGPAMFWDTPFEEVKEENIVERKWVGMLTITLGNPAHPHHANHLFYSYRRPIANVKREIYWAQVEDAYFPVLESCGERVWMKHPEKVTYELASDEKE